MYSCNIKTTDPEGRSTQYQYDSRNKVTKIIDNAGGEQTMRYRMDGLLLSRVDAAGKRVDYRYDRAGRLIEVQDGVGNKVTTKYIKGEELSGRLVEQRDTPNHKEVYQYDKRNRVIVSTKQSTNDDNLSSTTRIEYTARGERAKEIDANGKITEYQYNEHGELISSTNPAGERVAYQYDTRGNLVQVTDALGYHTYYTFDKNNNTTTETRPTQGEQTQAHTQRYQYNALNQQTKKTDYVGNQSVSVYDKDGRLTQQRHSKANASAAENTTQYSYDKSNLRTGYTDSHSASQYKYDTLGRMSEQSTQFTTNNGQIRKTLKHAYYANGQLKSKTDAEGQTTLYRYDAAGRLVQISLPTIGSVLVNQYQGMLPKRMSYPGGATREHRYDGLGRLNQILVKDNAEHAKLRIDYQFDKVGNITQKTTQFGAEQEKEHNYQYDNAYRLTQAEQDNAFGNQAYQYDANSNRTQKSITKNSNNTNQTQTQQYNYNNKQELSAIQTANQNSSTNNNPIQYNANGAQIQRQTQDQTQTLNYNSQGRLQSIQTGNKKIAEYRYDPYQRRISKTTNKDNTNTTNNTETTYYLYDDTGAGLVAEYNQKGDLIRGYGYAPNATFTTDAVYLKTPNKPQTNTQTNNPDKTYSYHYYQNDHLGTPQLLLNQYSAAVWHAEYDAFGAIKTKNSSLNQTNLTQPLRFAGQYHDTESNLYYNWHRYYNANTGRYISSDPIGLDGGMNYFGYVYQSPLAWYDYNGETPAHVAAMAAAGAAMLCIATRCGEGAFNTAAAAAGAVAGVIFPSDGDDSPSSIPQPVPLNPVVPKGKKNSKYKCTSQCNLYTNKKCIECPPRSGLGIGYGNTPGKAKLNAEKSAKTSVPQGCGVRHCYPKKCWKNGRPIKIF